MSEKRFTRVEFSNGLWGVKDNNTEYEYPSPIDLLDLLNELEEEKEYWKSKAMTLLMQVRRLTPRMTDKEVMEFSKELEDER